jgi:glutamate-5-semialdehyde dehydrogenase
MNANMKEIGKNARRAARQLAVIPTKHKTDALLHLADLLASSSGAILEANGQDVEAATQSGLSPALLDRLTLNPTRLEGIAADLRQVATLPDPVGESFEEQTLPNGLQVKKLRVPLGVLGVIYEARPNVTVDVSGLAIKSGNAAILRGGSETIASNRALVTVIRQALLECELPVDAIQFVDDPDRARVTEMLHMYEYIDMLIPRGGAALHQFCRENSRIPVITGGIGICHLFVDESADLDAALDVIQNAKVQRPTVCNALDTLLLHRAVAEQFMPRVVERLSADGVTFRLHENAMPLAASLAGVSPAGPNDFDTEWLSLVLGIKIVDNLDEAVEHIAEHSTAHSDGILTREAENAQHFVNRVDSSVVYVNASTRFTDGGQLGLGAEVAVSTQRLHARGPMALRELTTYKWVIEGNYHIRP